MTNQNNREELGMFDQSSMHHLGANLRRCIKRNNNQRLLRNRSSILDVSITHSLDFAVLVLISLTPAVIAAPVLSDCQAQSREFSDYPKGVSLWKTELLNKRIRSSPLSFPIAFGSHIPDISRCKCRIFYTASYSKTQGNEVLQCWHIVCCPTRGATVKHASRRQSESSRLSRSLTG